MTPRTSLRWRLRDATSGAHARLDARVGGAFDDPAGYAAFLRGMHAFVATAARVTGDGALVASQAALTADLADLGLDAAPPAAVARADAGAALGWRYVAAGASLGARVLLPRAQGLGFDARHGARYLALQAASGAWRGLIPELEVVSSRDETAAAVAGAHAAFSCAEAAMAEAFDAVHA
jgi:heme oxygenase